MQSVQKFRDRRQKHPETKALPSRESLAANRSNWAVLVIRSRQVALPGAIDGEYVPMKLPPME